MSKIYEDALKDAKKIREKAEQNAKNKILEALAPRIKRLIESEIMEEDSIDDSDMEDFFADELDTGEELDTSEAAPDDMVSDAGAELPSLEDPMDMGTNMGLDSLEFDDLGGGISQPTEFSFEKDGKQIKVSVVVEGKKRNISVSKLFKMLKEAKNNKQKAKILKEIGKIKKELIIKTKAGDKNSSLKLKAINLLLKENKKMATKRLNENWWMNEADEEEIEMDDEDMDMDDEAEDMEDIDLEDEDMGDEEFDIDAVKSAVESLADALNMSVSEEGGDVDMDMEDEDMDIDMDMDDEEFDFDEEEDLDEADELEESDKLDEADELEESDKDEEIMEISESLIRREIAKMRKTRNKGKRKSTPASRKRAAKNKFLAESKRRRLRRRRLKETGDPMNMQSSFGGSDEVIEVDKDDLINALAEELGNSHNEELNIDKSGDAKKAAKHFGGGKIQSGPAELKESRKRNRLLNKKLAAATKKLASAQRELKESNVLNTKLVYVNKLMQNYELNTKQQRAIVEALDNAKTLREAKLLYVSLTESLKKGQSTSKGKRTMTESVNRTSSASKSVQSSAPAKNDTELGRWAVLAGINNNK